MTASTALFVMSLPHDGPTALRVTWSLGTWPILASSLVTGLDERLLLVVVAGGLDLDVDLARLAVGELGIGGLAERSADRAQVARTVVTDAVVGTSQTVPPRKSMLKLSPRTPSGNKADRDDGTRDGEPVSSNG